MYAPLEVGCGQGGLQVECWLRWIQLAGFETGGDGCEPLFAVCCRIRRWTRLLTAA